MEYKILVVIFVLYFGWKFFHYRRDSKLADDLKQELREKFSELPFESDLIHDPIVEEATPAVPLKDGMHESKVPFSDDDEIVMMDARVNIKNGKFDGEYTLTDVDGRVRLNMHYKDGEKIGIHEHFAANGELLSRTEYLNDVEHGIEELYDDAGTGRLVVRGQKVNGQDHGDFEYLDEDGSVFMTITYENGEEVSTVRSDK